MPGFCCKGTYHIPMSIDRRCPCQQQALIRQRPSSPNGLTRAFVNRAVWLDIKRQTSEAIRLSDVTAGPEAHCRCAFHKPQRHSAVSDPIWARPHACGLSQGPQIAAPWPVRWAARPDSEDAEARTGKAGRLRGDRELEAIDARPRDNTQAIGRRTRHENRDEPGMADNCARPRFPHA